MTRRTKVIDTGPLPPRTSPADAKTVTRYVATYVNKNGMRTLMCAAQGRNTYATADEAQDWINNVTANNSRDAMIQAWGFDPRFEVRPCTCWAGHFDPVGVWFD